MIHNFDPVFLDFGIFQIRWYSIAYILGILLGWIYANRIIKNTNKKYNLISVDPKLFEDLLIYLIVGMVVGGRLGYVIFYNLEYYSKNLNDIYKIWQGGMSFHGGLIGIILASYIFSKIKKINFFKYTDIVACVTPIGLFLGRLANFINGELFGKVSSVSWGIIFPNGGNLPRHPSQLYEALLEGVLLFILINFFALKKNLLSKPGYVSGLFLIFYSIFRICAEYFREPDKQIGYILNYFSMGSLLSLVTFLFGLIIIYFIKNEQSR